MGGKYYTYLARCSDTSLYTGSTRNLVEREKRHNRGEGSNHTKQRLPVKTVYHETFDTLEQAVKREMQIKGWTRQKKENLIAYGHPNPNKKSYKNKK